MVEEKINSEREVQEMKKASKRKSTASPNRLLFLKSIEEALKCSTQTKVNALKSGLIQTSGIMNV